MNLPREQKEKRNTLILVDIPEGPLVVQDEDVFRKDKEKIIIKQKKRLTAMTNSTKNWLLILVYVVLLVAYILEVMCFSGFFS